MISGISMTLMRLLRDVGFVVWPVLTLFLGPYGPAVCWAGVAALAICWLLRYRATHPAVPRDGSSAEDGDVIGHDQERSSLRRLVQQGSRRKFVAAVTFVATDLSTEYSRTWRQPNITVPPTDLGLSGRVLEAGVRHELGHVRAYLHLGPAVAAALVCAGWAIATVRVTDHPLVWAVLQVCGWTLIWTMTRWLDELRCDRYAIRADLGPQLVEYFDYQEQALPEPTGWAKVWMFLNHPPQSIRRTLALRERG